MWGISDGYYADDTYFLSMNIWSTSPSVDPEVGAFQFAYTVLNVSSEWTTHEWGSRQILGYPNVYPYAVDSALVMNNLFIFCIFFCIFFVFFILRL